MKYRSLTASIITTKDNEGGFNLKMEDIIDSVIAIRAMQGEIVTDPELIKFQEYSASCQGIDESTSKSLWK